MARGHTGAIRLIQFRRMKWNRAMAIPSPELSISEMAGLLCAIILILIPLTIWVFCDLERQKRDRWRNSGEKSIRAKTN